MSAIDKVCGKLVKSVNGSVLCAAVDLDSGIILALQPGGVSSKSLGPVLAESAVRLVRGAVIGKLVSALESPSPEQNNAESAGYLQEAQLSTPEHCMFCRTIADGKVLALLVTSRDVSVGMGWAHLKAALPELESAVY